MKLSLSRKNIWEKTPPRLKYALGSVAKVMPLPYLLGSEYRKWDKIVSNAETWTNSQVRQYQLDRLREITSVAYQNSAYYRETFKASGFDPKIFNKLEYIERLPFIDKHTINNHRGDILTVAPNSPGLDYVATGGSSGEPLRFLIGKNRSSIEYAHLARAWMRIGYDHNTPKAALRGQVLNAAKDGLHYAFDPLLRTHFFSNFHLDDSTMRRYLECIAAIGPCYLHTYPSTLSILVRFIKRNGVKPPNNIKGLLLESENVYPDDRKSAEQVFNVPYFSSYGHSEKLVMAAECEHSPYYHVFPTYGYCELIDKNGRPINTPGEEGEIVGTGFINHAMPFIRYRTGDYATYVGDHCEHCRRQHLVIKNIRGHNTMETLVAFDGTLIPYSAVNVHDDTFESVLQFQYMQETPGKAILKLVPSRSHREIDERMIVNRIESRLQGKLKVETQFVDEIKLTPRGKSIFVDQRIDVSI